MKELIGARTIPITRAEQIPIVGKFDADDRRHFYFGVTTGTTTRYQATSRNDMHGSFISARPCVRNRASP